jgi:hypothetical protein
MNIKDDIVTYHSRFKPIPKPYYVVRCGDHFMVCKIDDSGDYEELSAIHWDHWTVRRWAFEMAKGDSK